MRYIIIEMRPTDNNTSLRVPLDTIRKELETASDVTFMGSYPDKEALINCSIIKELINKE